jgi:hypothetical protein
VGQKSFDGKEKPKPRSQRIREMLRDNALKDPKLDYDALVGAGIRLGIFVLDEVSAAARKKWRSEIEQVARRMKDKSGAPAIVPVADEPHQGVLLDAGRTEDRFQNVLERGLQTFGHQSRWSASARDMTERGEETLPVAEFREGWAEILARYRLEAAARAMPLEDAEEDDADEEE